MCLLIKLNHFHFTVVAKHKPEGHWFASPSGELNIGFNSDIFAIRDTERNPA